MRLLFKSFQNTFYQKCLAPFSFSKSIKSQIAGSFLMVKPIDFGFNLNVLPDSYKAIPKVDDAKKVNQKALFEFNEFVKTLRAHGINVLVFDKSKKHDLANDITPESLFVKSWISMGPSGNIILYPMANKTRECEKHAFRYILEELTYNYQVNRVYNLVSGPNKFLEGTGSLMIDRLKRRAYCSQSPRQDKELFDMWAWKNSYQLVWFQTEALNGKPYYHTKLPLVIAKEFTLVVPDAIVGSNKDEILKLVGENREVINITREQAENYNCTKVLQVKSFYTNHQYIVMSEKAYKGYTQEQLQKLKKYGQFIVVSIPTIENYGGGSASSLMAEIFLPLKETSPLYQQVQP